MFAGRYTGQPSLITQPQLCEECNKNQASKILELNSFEPSREVGLSFLINKPLIEIFRVNLD